MRRRLAGSRSGRRWLLALLLLAVPLLALPRTVHTQATPTVSIAAASAEEGDTITFTVSLSATAAGSKTVQYATSVEAGDTASADDFMAASGTLTFAASDTEQTFTVDTTTDTTAEADETFTVTLTMPSGLTIGTATAKGTILDDDTPAFSVTSASATEGDDVTFTVTLSPASSSETTVRYATSSGTATQGTDYTAASGTLTFDANDTSKTFTVATDDDDLDEDDETFTVTLTSPSTGSKLGAATATGTINDNDTVAFSINDVSGNEGGTLTFTVTASPRSAKPVTVEYATSNGTALAGTHYTSKSGTLTFPANVATQTFGVVTQGDSKDDIDRNFTVTLDNQSAGTLTDATGTGTITDNDPEPALSIATPSAVAEGDSGTKTMTFVVTLSAQTLKQVTVNYTTEDGTATAGDDYTTASGTLTFTADTTTLTQNIEVTVAGDELDEADSDTFTVKLSSAVNASIRTATATGTITDDDDRPALSIAGETTSDETGTVDFTVSLSAVSGRAVSVNYATSAGTATQGTDYSAASDTLNFAAGEESKTVSVTILGDSLDEDDETLTMRLSGPTNATVDTATATGTITDDDPLPTVSINDISVTETNANQNVQFTVSLSAVSGRTVTVSYETADGTATAGNDYAPLTSRTLTFSAGQQSKMITVQVLGDTLDEHTEAFTVELSSPGNASIGDGTGEATITDNDPPPSLSIADVSFAETDATAQMQFTVRLNAASGKEVTVNYATSGGTAVEGTDYTAASDKLTFAPGDRTKTFDVEVTGDTLDEDNETFTVTLSMANNATVPDPTATGTIRDNDPLPALSIAAGSASEDAGTVDLDVTLTPASGREVTVRYATSNGTAVAGTDYAAGSGTLTFAEGDTSKTIEVDLLDDSLDEENETFTVTLSSATNASVTTTAATGRIEDDDPPPALTVMDSSVIEPDGTATRAMTFTVELDAPSAKTITVNYATSGDTATEGTDYNRATGTLTFNAGITSRTFDVTVRGDDDYDATTDETFTVTLAGESNATLGTATATGTIIDNEGPPRLVIDDPTVTEGDAGSKNVTFTVTLLGSPTELTVTTAWETMDGPAGTGATAGADYTADSGTLTFTSPVRSQTVVVAVLGDTLDEHNETFTVELSSPTVATLGKASGTGTITDNDPLPRVALYNELRIPTMDDPNHIHLASEEEGDTVRFPVTLSTASGRDVVVNYRTVAPLSANVAAEPDVDYTAADSMLTIAAGETLGYIEVATIEDTILEHAEAFDVLMSLPAQPHATLVSGRTRVEGEIVDDEGTPMFSIDDVTAAEDNGTITFTVSLSPAYYAESSVSWLAASSPGDTASADIDYSTGRGTLTFAPTETTRTLTVELTDDPIDEEDETFTVTVGKRTDGTLVSKKVGTGTITDNDDAPTASVSDARAREDARAMSFTVRLTEASGRLVTLQYDTADGTAMAGADYEAATSEALVFSLGDTSRRVQIPLIQDTTAEMDETFTLTLSNQDGTATVSDTDATATGTIADDEGRPRLSIADATEIENTGPMTFTVTLSLESAFEVTANWATSDGTAEAGTDYTAVTTGTVTFAAGEVSKEIAVPLIDDSVHDDGETFTVTLSGSPNADIRRATATGTIVDDEGPPRLAIADAEITEGNSGETATMAFTVTMTGDPVADVTVNYQTRGGTATQGTDFEAQTGTLTFDQSAGETSKNIEVVVRGDADREDDETFSVRLSTARMGAERVEIVDAEATGTIIDDEPGVLIRPLTLTIPEGSTTTYDVRLRSQPAGNVTIDITSDNEDVTVTAASLTFTTGDWNTAQTVTVEAAQDDDGTHDRATLTHAVTGYGALTSGPDVRVSVTDDEAPPPVIFLGNLGGGPTGPEPSEADFEWTVTHDIETLDSRNSRPTGMWSDGATLWLADNAEGAGDAVYAYDLASGERSTELEFTLDPQNRAPRGVWSDGATAWVSDSGRDQLFAYDLVTGGRLEDRDIVLAGRNRDARDFWSDGSTMWVLNHNPSLFAYNLDGGALLAEYQLDDANSDPRGIWSDGVTVWVSDHGAKRLFAYRLPMPEAPAEGGGEDPGEALELERLLAEEFMELSTAGNLSPRGIWSDGAVMYVADANDGRVYSYNIPDAFDTRLASLSLEGVDIGEFDPGRSDYEGVVGDGVTETTVAAEARQSGATVAIDPADGDGETAGHQVTLEGIEEITVTVTSADGARTRTYRVVLPDPEPEPPPQPCLRGAVAAGFSLVVYEGGSVEDLAACAESRNVTALYTLHQGDWVSYILGAPGIVNQRFGALYADGVPALTPLVASSEGPPSADPGAPPATEPFATCLLGEIGEGFSLVLYEGGSVPELAACAEGRALTAVYVLTGGEWVSYILGAPAFVNAEFSELFRDGVPTLTPLVVAGDRPQTGAESDTEPPSGEDEPPATTEEPPATTEEPPATTEEPPATTAPRQLLIANTDGVGVSHRDDCADDARLPGFGWAEGQRVEVIEEGGGRCAGWSHVRTGDVTSWVREQYLAEPPAATGQPSTTPPRQLVIANTGGAGVSHRNDCADDARLPGFGWAEGQRVEVIEEGGGRCAGWLRVRGGDVTSWVREEYVTEA